MIRLTYANVLASTNPCPACVEASEQSPMTLDEWRASEWGLPGSSGRYCEDDCHCILIPEELLPEFPQLAEGGPKLRGEPGSDIRAIVEIGPNEEKLKLLMEIFNENIGKLPKDIYSLPIDEVISLLEKIFQQNGIEVNYGG